ncbi:pleckstrin domain superfamily protein [Tanacetum coccineum]|uniref:Pleckstrin domain superfamily protein n=1 Tax=Tanacetum coccineum TaxID=301880 RepID=A0ABQ4WDS3_9ASTR
MAQDYLSALLKQADDYNKNHHMAVLKALESSATFKDLLSLAKFNSNRIEDLRSNCGGVLDNILNKLAQTRLSSVLAQKMESQPMLSIQNSVQKHTYVLQPVTGNAKYSKQRSNSSNRDHPLQKAAVSLDDVTISMSKSGYRDVLVS